MEGMKQMNDTAIWIDFILRKLIDEKLLDEKSAQAAKQIYVKEYEQMKEGADIPAA